MVKEDNRHYHLVTMNKQYTNLETQDAHMSDNK